MAYIQYFQSQVNARTASGMRNKTEKKIIESVILFFYMDSEIKSSYYK